MSEAEAGPRQESTNKDAVIASDACGRNRTVQELVHVENNYALGSRV